MSVLSLTCQRISFWMFLKLIVKKTMPFSNKEIREFHEDIKGSKTVDETLIKQINDKNKRTEALSACFRNERKDISPIFFRGQKGKKTNYFWIPLSIIKNYL